MLGYDVIYYSFQCYWSSPAVPQSRPAFSTNPVFRDIRRLGVHFFGQLRIICPSCTLHLEAK